MTTQEPDRTHFDPWRDVVKAIPEHSKQATSLLQAWKEIAVGLVLLFMRTFTTVPQLFLHRRHGLRTLGVLPFVLAIASLSVPTIGGRLPWVGRPAYTATGLLTFLVVMAFLLHRVRAGRRHHRGEPFHSRTSAHPHGVWDLVPWFHSEPWRVMKFGEPVLLLLVGLALRFGLGSAMGTYLILCAAALHLRCVLMEFHQRSKILDMLDQQIEAEHLSGSIEDRETARDPAHGWVVPVPAPAGRP